MPVLFRRRGRSKEGHASVLYSGFRWPHHDKDSGYDHVVMSAADYVNGNLLLWGDAPIGSVKRRFNFLLIDLMTIFRSWRYSAVVIFYPEQTVFVSPICLRIMRKRVVCVLHLGIDFWSQRENTVAQRLKLISFRCVSCFITLSRHQQVQLSKLFNSEMVVIPHGMLCDGAINLNAKREARITIIGDNYRDYAAIEEIIGLTCRSHPKVKFDMIGVDREKLISLKESANAVFYPHLSSSEYKAIVQRSLFILLPLTFASANNALLEGMSCGIPVYCSNIEGVRDYLLGDEYLFGSPTDVARIITERLQQDEPARLAERKLLVEFVQSNFEWSKVQRAVIGVALSPNLQN
ncbi:glycosyltransferase [Bradyrhizobium sp. RDM12]